MMKKFVFYILAFFVLSNIHAQTSDLSIEMLVDNTLPYIRSTIKFTITVNNDGPDEATGVNVVNEFGTGYGKIDSISDNGIAAGNTVSWYDLKVPPNSNIFLHFSARVLANGNYRNRAEITASDNYDPNSDPGAGFDDNDLNDRYIDDDEVELTSVVPIPSNFDNDRLFDFDDLDDDNDGIPDALESNGIDPDSDYDQDGTPVYLDDNDDNFDIGDDDDLVASFFDLDVDNIPNHLDYDSDGDGIFDIYEAGITDVEANAKGRINGAFLSFGGNGLYDPLETAPDSGQLRMILLNTDEDDSPNFLDEDDDNDGILTINENADPNGDGDPEDAMDSDNDGFPDYLDSDTATGTNVDQEIVAVDEFQEAFPRTASIRLRNSSIEVKLFTERGIEVTPDVQRVGNLVQLDISSLNSGIYFLQFKSKGKVEIKRMVIN